LAHLIRSLPFSGISYILTRLDIVYQIAAMPSQDR
jgi:hypothetical protein